MGLAAAAALAFAPAAGAADPDSEISVFFGKTHAPLSMAPPAGTGELALILAPNPGAFNAWRAPIVAAPEVLGAGSHPDASGGLSFTQSVLDGLARNVLVDTPPGFVGDPQAVPACPLDEFYKAKVPDVAGGCTVDSQVGTATVVTGLPSNISPIYNLTPPRGAPAAFGFWITNPNVPTIMIPELRADGNYSVRLATEDIPTYALLKGVTATIWGSPYDPAHDVHRWNKATARWGMPAPTGRKVALLSNPTDCGPAPAVTELRVNSWREPTRWRLADYTAAGPTVGCERLSFGSANAPVSLDAQPTSRAVDSPTGLSVKLRLPYNDSPSEPARPTLRDAEVRLPEGMTINAAAGDGLQGCTPAQIGLKTDSEVQCPAASKLGSVRVKTPLLKQELSGSLYQAMPFDNPFDSLLAVYLVVVDEDRGILVKLPGQVKADKVTGALTSTFEDNPQLPFTEMDLDLKSGPRAPLVAPRLCGTHETVSTLTPWSYPQSGPAVIDSDPFETVAGEGGCSADLADRPLALSFDAGTVNASSRAFSPFVMRLVRGGGSQELDRIDVAAPEGLVGSLAGIPYCSEDGIARAFAREVADAGRVEMADPSCPEASRVGRTTVGAGAGSSPLFVDGKVYLAGPYKGAPLSLVFVVPAVAGPFDLGVQTVRVALSVDRRTAQVTAESDPIPKILEGIPLRIRDVRVDMDHPRFTLNPSNCDEQRVEARVAGSHGAQSDLSSRFQVGDCAALAFKPRLSLALVGKNQRTTGKHPGINAMVKQAGVGEAGIKKAVVRLPKSLALDVNNAQALCEYEDGTKPDLENHCPAGSIIGRARAKTPLLDDDLAGNVYFVKNIRRDPKTGNEIRTLPMLVVALRGQVSINLIGESDTTKAGKLVNTFNGVPDAPVNQFNMNIKGGSNGIIAVTRTRRAKINLCTRPQSHVAEAEMDGQNGRRYDRDILMKTPCTKRQINKAKRAAQRAAAKR